MSCLQLQLLQPLLQVAIHVTWAVVGINALLQQCEWVVSLAMVALLSELVMFMGILLSIFLFVIQEVTCPSALKCSTTVQPYYQPG